MYIVSPSPHIQTKTGISHIMFTVLIALLPAFVCSVWFYGFSALIVTLTAILSCVLFEFAIQKYLFRQQEYSIKDGSAILTGALLAFNLPSSFPLWMIIIGSLVAIGIAKMSFGGLGNNIFNPALVARVFLLISFPVEMTLWPQVSTKAVDALTAPTPLGILKHGIESGKSISYISELPSYYNLFIGNIGGSLGEISAIALLIGGLYLLARKVITWHIPISVIVSMYVFAGIFHIFNPETYINPLFHILSGGAMLGAWFMATDMVTSPMTKLGQIIFGVGIGVITMIIRLWGAYPEGMSFAILLMNAVVPLLNKMQPKKFGA